MPRDLIAEEAIKLVYNKMDMHNRRAVLRDTVEKLTKAATPKHFVQQAQANHERWKTPKMLPFQVQVMPGDWGDVARTLSELSGHIYAVLNMANAFVPGGGYLEGMVAQEENMYRRTDCHFYVHDAEMDKSKSRYTQEMTNLINGANGRVYLDAVNPRVCIKGPETTSGEGYPDLTPEQYFLFYELKSAADDLRNGAPFNEASMRKKIAAQLDTLIEKKIRHVILSAFGCGAFGNPADKVATIYKEELIKRPGAFDDVVFAIYNAGYGPDNFEPFRKIIDMLPLNANTIYVDQCLSALKNNVNQTTWDQRGYVLPFFNFRKTPGGIVQLRTILNKDMDPVEKIEQLQKIARERLANPPRFTHRDDKVKTLYEDILKIKMDAPDASLIQRLESDDEESLKQLGRK